MLLVTIILLFALLALLLLAWLDRYDADLIKSQAAARQAPLPQKLAYYDAFVDRRQKTFGAPPAGQPDRRKTA